MTAQHWDAIVVGGGHNGLVCATYLAKAGRQRCCLSGANASAEPSTRPRSRLQRACPRSHTRLAV